MNYRTSLSWIIGLLVSLWPLFTAGQSTVLTPSLWLGKIGGLRLVLVIDTSQANQPLHGHFESPDQTDKPLPIAQLQLLGDSLIARCTLIGGTLRAHFNATDQLLVGTWQQGRMAPMPMTLQRQTTPIGRRKRPQTPLPPFPYRSDSVQFANADQSIRFSATLTRPYASPNNQRYPAVILISGSGPQDRDETLFAHKPFAVLADYLTRRGIAVLRVDDRGVGQSTGRFSTATSAHFAQDVLAAIAYLKGRSDIRFDQLGLIGHSDGGLVAPLVATQSTDVAFIVSLAGVGIKGDQLLKQQLATSHQLAGMPLGAQRAIAALFDPWIDQVAQTTGSIGVDELLPSYSVWKAHYSADLIKQTGITEPAARSFCSSLLTPWMRYFLAYDPAPTLRQLRLPVLALNGQKDYQVDAKANLQGFELNLRKAKNQHYQVVSLPGLNHLFQTASTGSGEEYIEIEETIAPTVLIRVGDWVQQQTRSRRR